MEPHNQELINDEKPDLDRLQARLSLYGTFVTMLSIFLGFLLATVALVCFSSQLKPSDLLQGRLLAWLLVAAYYVLIVVLVRQHSETLRQARKIDFECLPFNDELMTLGLTFISVSFSFMMLAAGFTVWEVVLSGIIGVAISIFGFVKVKRAKKDENKQK
jgi:hypothetical protein